MPAVLPRDCAGVLTRVGVFQAGDLLSLHGGL